MSASNEGPYVGRSSEEDEPTLEKAIKNAYKKAREGSQAGR